MSTILNDESKEKSFWEENKIVIILMGVFAIIFALIIIFIINGDKEKKLEVPPFESQYAPIKKGAMVAELVVKDYGTIKIQLFESEAPLACENFITHAKNGYYDGVKFHRVIEDFMIQSGDPEGTGAGGESIWGEYFENETSDYLMPIRGALCMANAGENMNGSQFFIVQQSNYDIDTVINLREKTNLDDDLIDYYKEVGGSGELYGGYTVFGQVFEGMEVVDKIAVVDTDSEDMPNEDVIIETIKIYQYE